MTPQRAAAATLFGATALFALQLLWTHGQLDDLRQMGRRGLMQRRKGSQAAGAADAGVEEIGARLNRLAQAGARTQTAALPPKPTAVGSASSTPDACQRQHHSTGPRPPTPLHKAGTPPTPPIFPSPAGRPTVGERAQGSQCQQLRPTPAQLLPLAVKVVVATWRIIIWEN